jgi:hypothetical protein
MEPGASLVRSPNGFNGVGDPLASPELPDAIHPNSGPIEIWEIFVTIVADVPPEPDPGISNETTLLGKFVATN